MPSFFVVFMQKRLAYVELMVSCSGGYEKKKEALVAECMSATLQAIKGNKKLTPEDAMEVKTMLDGRIPEANVTTVMNAMQARIGLAPSGNKAEDDKQVNLFLDCYQTEDDWSLYRNADADISTKLMNMARIIVSSGMSRCSEKTFGLGAAIVEAGCSQKGWKGAASNVNVAASLTMASSPRQSQN